MPFCIHCGSPIETGDRFCLSCGATLEEGGDSTRHQPGFSPIGSHPAKVDQSFVEEEIMPLRPRGPVVPSAGKIALGIFILLIIAAGAYVIFSGSLPVTGKTAPAAGSANVPGSGAILPVNGQCSSGLSLCGGSCVDLRKDPNNCGACGFKVPYGMVCSNGEFASLSPTATTLPPPSPTASPTPAPSKGPCPSGQNLCNGKCADIRADNDNCGKCGWDCPKGQVCQSGTCLPPELTPVSTATVGVTVTKEAFCSYHEIVCNGSCVDILTDIKNCGVCGRSCKSQETCLNGRCGPACSKSGTTLCDKTCVDLRTDTNNCGACGTSCPSSPPNSLGSLCSQGKCSVSGCKQNYGDCNTQASDGCETDLRFADNNCGTCGVTCPAGQKCSLSQCI
jgi:hypothetical protein